jgi:molybdate-binding protein
MLAHPAKNLLAKEGDGADVAGRHVVVHIPSRGTLLGETVERHPGARATLVQLARREVGHSSIVDNFALVEGVPDHAIAQMLLAWNLRYGVPASVVGGPFALRLPVRVD